MTFSVRLSLPLMFASAVGCVAPTAPREGVHPATPVDAAIGAGMAADELARGKPQRVVLGWKLEIVGEQARFYSCTAEDACTERVVEVPAKAVLAVKVVGRTKPTRDDGTTAGETDLLRVTLANDVSTSRGGVAADPHRGLTIGAGRAK